jgi:SAM-dependent methyltransferase
VLDDLDERGAISLKMEGFAAFSLELDPHLVAAFRDRPESAGIGLCQGDAIHMPYKDGSFAGATLIEVIEHVPDTVTLLDEIRRVLKPGAHLCLGVPTSYTEKLYGRLHPDYAKNAGHVKIFTRPALQAALERARFRVDHVEPRNLEPAVSWVFHASLRSQADHTGAIHEHQGVDRVLSRIFRVWARIPGLREALFWLSRHLGKSWYVYATAT